MRGSCPLFPLVVLALWATAAGAADPDPAACRAALDVALARIGAEEEAIRSMLDADAAILDVATYQLSKTETALLADLAADRARVEAKYRACLARGSGRTR